ncbi:MAG TPA: hypothetical protein VJ783_21105 [Pirellulales bacterium]|nr:hypothetical protein [Pirellulales bacterium]
MKRPQFTVRALLVLMLVVAAFFGGIRFGERRERDRRTREDDARAKKVIADMLKFQADMEEVFPLRREHDGLPSRRRASEADKMTRQKLKEVAK